MSPVVLNALPPASNSPTDRPKTISDAAQQFEALLLGQILRMARQGNGSSDDCAMELAEQHLASSLAKNGGLGLARLIGQGLGAHKLQA